MAGNGNLRRLLGMLSIICVAAAANENGHLVLSIGKNSYTTEDLTRFKQKKVDKVLQKASGVLENNNSEYSVGRNPLGGTYFEPNAAPDAATYYDACLKEVTHRFLAGILFKRFKAEYNTDASAYYDKQKMFQAARQYAKLNYRMTSRVCLPAMKRT